MQPQPRTTPRKRPRQTRSKATVDAILDATTRVLLELGFDGLTTNAVAHTAGVSIGSLYQYFPNKEALVAAVIERHIEAMNESLLAELGRVAALPLPEAVRRLVEVTIHGRGVDPELRRMFVDYGRRVGKLARLRQLDEGRHRMV